MGKIANKQVICEVLMEAAKTDQDIVALCSDSRGSASFAPFASEYPEQFVETGIAEQNLVKHLRWPGQMREEALCGVSGMLPPPTRKAMSSAKSMWHTQYKCKTDRHQRRRIMGRWE